MTAFLTIVAFVACILGMVWDAAREDEFARLEGENRHLRAVNEERS